jgi:8-oxo-dGTP diphosphatase
VNTSEVVHVVAGILRDVHGRVLLAQRPPGKHLAGLWEFPGGKCEPGEPPEQALRRELHEELGIDIAAAERLIAVPWTYPQKSILLDVYSVPAYDGTVHGREGQGLRWEEVGALGSVPMPPADRPVIAALRLPTSYVISPEPADADKFLQALRCVLDAGAKCIQLRSKHFASARLRDLAQTAKALAAASGAQLLLNGHIELARELRLGVHLPAAQLMRLTARPLGDEYWVAASCHDKNELAHAAQLGIDFAVIGPVQRTATHAGVAPLGWTRFAALCALAPFPVYALGGLGPNDLAAARAAGAQGVAGISAFWR